MQFETWNHLEPLETPWSIIRGLLATLVTFCHFDDFSPLCKIFATLAIFCHFGNFSPNLVALFGHIHFIDLVSTSINSLLTVLRRGNAFWLLLAFFGTFWQLLWPIFIPGQFVISPYSNIFWLVHLCNFGTFCTNLVALFCEVLPNLVALFGKLLLNLVALLATSTFHCSWFNFTQ